MKIIDSFLNKTTMYRVVLYYLAGLIGIAMVLGAFGLLPYNPLAIVFSLIFITAVCWVFNIIFARIYKAPANVESFIITAFILVLLITPPIVLFDTTYLWLAFWMSAWAIASKYIFAIKKKHVFNPVAIGAVITALVISGSASWWIATLWMMPFVLIGGLLVTKKVLRFDLVLSFLATAVIAIGWGHVGSIADLWTTLSRMVITTPILFFAFAMLTEPLTTPPTRFRRILYGVFVGVLFAPWIHIGGLYFTPELALIVGNVLAYLLSSKTKLILQLKEKIKVAEDTYDFIFQTNQKLAFAPGQYLEWTLGHTRPDNRGNRRYFTIASSPTEKDIRMGVKFYPGASTFKQKLLSMQRGETLVASQLSGDFVLPKDTKKKLVFIAGGIGVTPFRSMIKYLLDTRQKRNIKILYSNRTAEDVAYKELFTKAEQLLKIKTIYTLTDKKSVPDWWAGSVGYIDEAMIKKEVPDYKERMFYISGSGAMVKTFGAVLKAMGVPRSHIKKDFFPGFA